MGILDNRLIRDSQPAASAGSSLSCAIDHPDTFGTVLKQLSTLIESREDQIKRLEERLEAAAAREAIWMTVLEWYAAGPFGQRAADAIAPSPSGDAARIRREREMLIAPLLRSAGAARDGRSVKISFRDEAEAKAFRNALEQFIPTKPYFGMMW
ncbi:MAG TPA: hypothetical protein VHY80_15735 [Stellaceae bacterium]|jgi:hypothetical protein|nr:hypothetical protein [Stellaceae bacterium]